MLFLLSLIGSDIFLKQLNVEKKYSGYELAVPYFSGNFNFISGSYGGGEMVTWI